MPIQMNILEEYVINDEVKTYAFEPGYEVYCSPSITTLNKLPVRVLQAFITSKMKASDNYYGILPDDLAESLLVDGSIVVYGGELGHSKQWTVVNTGLATYLAEDGTFHVYMKLANDMWQVIVYEDNTEEKILTVIPGLASDQLYLYPNGRGILEPVQFTYYRLEEIEQSIRQQTSEAALSLIVSNYQGSDKVKAIREIKQGAKIIFIPGTDVTITRVGSSQVADQLMSEFDRLLPLYLRSTNVPYFNEGSTMSGVSRALMMQPTTRFVDQVQGHMENIYAEWKGTITFGTLTLLTPEERKSELELLTLKRDAGIITPDEFLILGRDI
jgi:hypothetical protein